MITCERMWRWLRRLFPIGCFVLLWIVPAGAQTFIKLERASEPTALAVVGASFLALSFLRRRSNDD